jgi:hypothetical protein
MNHIHENSLKGEYIQREIITQLSRFVINQIHHSSTLITLTSSLSVWPYTIPLSRKTPSTTLLKPVRIVTLLWKSNSGSKLVRFPTQRHRRPIHSYWRYVWTGTGNLLHKFLCQLPCPGLMQAQSNHWWNRHWLNILQGSICRGTA